MKLELGDFKNFKDVLITSELFLEEIKLEADTDGVRFRGLDRSHIAFLGMDISADYFDEYEIDEPDHCMIDTSDLVKVLKRSKNSDKLVFSFDNENIKLEFVNEDKNTKRKFNIRQIDMDYESPKPPMIEYPVNTIVNTKLIDDSLKDCELYSDKVKLQTMNNDLFIIADGDFGDYKSSIELFDDVSDAESSFSIDFLKRFFKLANLTEDIELKLGSNMPVSIVMDDDNGLKVDFLLAPRIEEDY